MNDAPTAGIRPGLHADAPDVPSLFFVSLPKSGTVFTWYTLQDATGLRMPDFHRLEGWNDYNAGRDFSCPDLYACGDYNTQLLYPGAMGHYQRGYIFGSHMQASYHNMRILKESGIDRITVLLRDPRDAFVSWVHHLRNLGPSARDYHSKIYHIPRAYYDWSLSGQFAWQVRTFLPVTVNWVEGWLDYYASPGRDIDVLFVYYDELKTRPADYIRRIVDFHGIPDADLTRIAAPEPGKMHYRKGEHGQWRVELTAEDQALVENLMQDRLAHAYDTAAGSDPAMRDAAVHAAAGEWKQAASSALCAIARFPNHAPAYKVFLEAGEKCGADVRELGGTVDTTLSDRSIEGRFIYRYGLIAACRQLSTDRGLAH